MSGFIALHRSLLDWEWYNEPNTCRVFIHCLLKANWKDKNYRGKLVKRGHFLTSLDLLAQETGLSVRNIRTAINNLKATNELTVLSTRQGTEIIINNYELYQEATSKTTNESTNDRQTDFDSNHNEESEFNEKSTGEATNGKRLEDIENKEENHFSSYQATNESTNDRQTTDKRPTHKATTTNKFNKENKVNNKNIYKSLDISVVSHEFDIDLIKEFIDHRINLKAKLTQQALERILKTAQQQEVMNLGFSPNQAIQETIDSGWKGLKVEWLANRAKPAQTAKHQKTSNIFDLQNRTYISGDL